MKSSRRAGSRWLAKRSKPTSGRADAKTRSTGRGRRRGARLLFRRAARTAAAHTPLRATRRIRNIAMFRFWARAEEAEAGTAAAAAAAEAPSSSSEEAAAAPASTPAAEEEVPAAASAPAEAPEPAPEPPREVRKPCLPRRAVRTARICVLRKPLLRLRPGCRSRGLRFRDDLGRNGLAAFTQAVGGRGR